MKIVFFQPPVIAGAMICLKELIAEFKKKNIDTYVVICGNYDLEIKCLFEQIKQEVIFFPMHTWIADLEYCTKKGKRRFRIRRLLDRVTKFPELDNLLKSIEPDIIYCNSFDEYLPLSYAQKRKIKSVIHLHEYGKLDHCSWFKDSDYAYKILKNVDLKIGISNAVVDFYEKEFLGLKINLVYDGISPLLIAEKDDNNLKEIKHIGVVGRICENKGQEFVIRNAWRFPEISFHIYGKCSNKEYEKKIVKLLSENKADNVVLEGYRNNPKEIYSEIDAIIAPSKCEAFGRIIIEAMLNKKIVIASNTGSFPELVRNNIDGFLFDLNDASFEQTMNNALHCDFEKVINEAHKKASENFLAEHNAKKIIGLLKGLI